MGSLFLRMAFFFVLGGLIATFVSGHIGPIAVVIIALLIVANVFSGSGGGDGGGAGPGPRKEDRCRQRCKTRR